MLIIEKGGNEFKQNKPLHRYKFRAIRTICLLCTRTSPYKVFPLSVSTQTLTHRGNFSRTAKWICLRFFLLLLHFFLENNILQKVVCYGDEIVIWGLRRKVHVLFILVIASNFRHIFFLLVYLWNSHCLLLQEYIFTSKNRILLLKSLESIFV